MLIPFPIAFFLGALVFDIVARANGSYNWFFVGYVCTIAGVLTGLVAALPGLVDYLKSIPGGTKARRIGTIHMVLNVTVVGLYIVSWILKAGAVTPSTGSLVLEIIGSALLFVSGWLGGKLVYEHHVGVDLESPEARELRERAAAQREKEKAA